MPLETLVMGSGVVDVGNAPVAEIEPGVTPPPPTEDFIIDEIGDFVTDETGNRLITE